MKPSLWLWCVCALALCACPGPDESNTTPDAGDAGSTGPQAGTDAGMQRPYPAPVAQDGALPCDVATVLASCTQCHGTTPTQAAPMSLATYKDLIAVSPIDPNALMIDRVIARMLDPNRPMPATGMFAFEVVEPLIVWRAAGMPPDSEQGCSTEPMSMCSSGKTWTLGNNGSELMNPGKACIECHTQLRGPSFHAAGTLYPTLREPDLCRGANGSTTFAGAKVELIDNEGREFPMTVNSAGNFYLPTFAGSVTLPIRARVTWQGKTREMFTPQSSGDCNSCHTQNGANGAPGRILLPE